jgi:hypothetical protein
MTIRRLNRELKQWQSLTQLQQQALETELSKLDNISAELRNQQQLQQQLQQDWDYAVALQTRDLAMRETLMNYLSHQHTQLQAAASLVSGLERQKTQQTSKVQQTQLVDNMMQAKQQLAFRQLATKALDAQELQVSELAGVYYANQR